MTEAHRMMRTGCIDVRMKIDYGPEKAQQSTKERALIPMSEISERTKEKQKACDELRDAANDGKVGDILAKHETLILQYYGDVQDQATKSFSAAQLLPNSVS